MKKYLLISIILLCGVFSTYAQSTVYFFAIESWVPIPIKINNQDAFVLKGSPKGKNLTSRYSPCRKECILYSEGKIVFSFEFLRTNQANTNIVYKYADEIQLTLSENSVHYILVKSKGFNDYTFQELSEKDGEKLAKNKKYVLTPKYVEQ